MTRLHRARLRTSPEFAQRAEGLKRDMLARPEIAAIAEGAWDNLRTFLERDAQGADGQIGRHLVMLVETGAQLARDPGIVPRSTAAWCACSPISWKVRRAGRSFHRRSGQVVGHRHAGRPHRAYGRPRSAVYIRFNGALIGGLAGLVLHVLEQGLKLRF